MTAPGLTFSGSAAFGNTPVFGPLTLEVPAERWTCLLGPSGVGKTTLLRLIAGLDDLTQFDGSITTSDGAPLSGRIALMAQSDLLMPWLSVLENTLLGARLRGQAVDRTRAHDVLARVRLSDHQDKRPGALSGGQRQRVALARTLMEDRPLVLLDEPFSALDAKTRAEMQDMACGLLEGRTVLMVTHEPGEAARLGHKITVMDQTGLRDVPPPKGAIPRAVDAPETLRAQADLLAQLLRAA
jgi:putative hydroxymethylpyrimidine transport system ATP-binding protein